MLCDIRVARDRSEQREASFDDGFLPKQHAPNVRMLDDRHRLATTLAELSPLLAVQRVRTCFVVRGRSRRCRIDADHDARLVHHLEHVAKTLVRLADQPAAAVVFVAELQRQTREPPPTDFVNHAGNCHVIRYETAVFLAEPRNGKQGNTLGSVGRTVDARQREIHDVLADPMVRA